MPSTRGWVQSQHILPWLNRLTITLYYVKNPLGGRADSSDLKHPLVSLPERAAGRNSGRVGRAENTLICL